MFCGNKPEVLSGIPNRTGTRWNMCSFRRNAERAWQKAGLPWFTPHTLRNLAATILADANASRDTISASLGHDQTATADIYVRARDRLRSATFGQKTLSDAIEEQLKRIDDAPMTHQTPKAPQIPTQSANPTRKRLN